MTKPTTPYDRVMNNAMKELHEENDLSRFIAYLDREYGPWRTARIVKDSECPLRISFSNDEPPAGIPADTNNEMARNTFYGETK